MQLKKKHQCPQCNHKPYRWASGLSRHIKDKHSEVRDGGQLPMHPTKSALPIRDDPVSALDTFPAPPRIADTEATEALALGEAPPPDYAAPGEAVAGTVVGPPLDIPFDNTLVMIKWVVDLSEAIRDGDIGSMKKPTVEELKIWAKNVAQMRGHDMDPRITVAVVSFKIFIPIIWNIIVGFRKWIEARKEKEAEEKAKAAKKEKEDVGEAD